MRRWVLDRYLVSGRVLIIVGWIEAGLIAIPSWRTGNSDMCVFDRLLLPEAGFSASGELIAGQTVPLYTGQAFPSLVWRLPR